MTAPAPKTWLAVASAEHVRQGVRAGIMQVCHGKAAPLRRLRPGDSVIYYSPTVTFRGGDRLQAFTALGRVGEGEPYPFATSEGFTPYRRNVAWEFARETPIRPLFGALAFAAGGNWGYALRFGLIEIGADDRDRIAAAMQG